MNSGLKNVIQLVDTTKEKGSKVRNKKDKLNLSWLVSSKDNGSGIVRVWARHWVSGWFADDVKLILELVDSGRTHLATARTVLERHLSNEALTFSYSRYLNDEKRKACEMNQK